MKKHFGIEFILTKAKKTSEIKKKIIKMTIFEIERPSTKIGSEVHERFTSGQS